MRKRKREGEKYYYDSEGRPHGSQNSPISETDNFLDLWQAQSAHWKKHCLMADCIR